MLSVGVGGYMEQWVGIADRSDGDVDGGVDVQSDSEIYFQGSLEADNGLKFTVHVQLEANNSGGGDSGDANTEIDESFARVSGDFGTLEIGQRDPIHARTHYAAAFGAGVGLNAGDSQKWIPGAYFETAGWTGGVAGDDLGVIYITPRVNGIQVGLSYHPDSTNENAPTGAPTDNDKAVVAAGINYNVNVADMSVKVSLGHLTRSQTGSVDYDSDGDGTDDMSKGFDDATYTNAGLSIGMGQYSFGVSYANRDGGGFMAAADEDGHEMAVEDGSGQHDTVAVGLGYTDGPMSFSFDYMNRDAENGDERTGTMVSMGYKLAPGVAWKSSIFGVEDSGSGAEGTAFVTGIDIDF